ncbi:Eukaryotic initiation factor eIF1/SUI [Acanthamoeba polyphaga moumouvirus]|uniref:Eukaryotic initiation factor eIF1/SUI n=2 Tax=Moumouvirus TaxID=3080801 RepID=L7RG10_9VIRU|nr:Eukaryotic initiation factor eIF1/SUI [Acanthamoeba polyphaga moumouvirus]AEX62883.1 protein translation factor SUI1-like protein [Moumouvirus Monve]AGC01885.1 Eukaryotic initiation factor eIF1/SUI [Acanthamoeba polyphaga moumouvirus]AQN68244.1 eukaryotic initiation factor eIF1/SUI [Saudi moumouvirus]
MLDIDNGIFDPMKELAQDKLMYTEKIHIKLVPRSKTRNITLVENLPNNININTFLKAMRQFLHCTGSIKENKEGKYVQFTGDHRETIKDFLINKSIAKNEDIILHGH